jgi:hypothetical protein
MSLVSYEIKLYVGGLLYHNMHALFKIIESSYSSTRQSKDIISSVSAAVRDHGRSSRCLGSTPSTNFLLGSLCADMERLRGCRVYHHHLTNHAPGTISSGLSQFSNSNQCVIALLQGFKSLPPNLVGLHCRVGDLVKIVAIVYESETRTKNENKKV